MDWEMITAWRLAGYVAGAVTMLSIVAVRVARDPMARLGLKTLWRGR